MPDKVVYLMRGLPSCGKSTTARELTQSGGIVLETDEYFYTQVGDDPTRYDYHADLLPAAREWNFERFVEAIAAGRSPIVVDRGNGLNAETRRYAQYAVKHGYRVELKEPDSPQWLEIRVLLQSKHANRQLLYQWADRLSEMSRTGHRVPAATIRDWMDKWRCDLGVDHILNYTG